jgi:exodeoxyribonuclease X
MSAAIEHLGVAMHFDTELTDRNDGEIIEAAWIVLESIPDLLGPCDRISLKAVEEWTQRFRPSKPITFGAMAVHHILPCELELCPPSSSFVVPPVVSYMIGHSIDTDWIAAGSPAGVRRIDTHAIAQWLWPDATGYSQSALIYMLEGATPETRLMLSKAHMALADCYMNQCLLRHILRLKPEMDTWSKLWEYSEACRIPRTCPLKRWEGVLLEDMDYDAIDWCLRQHWLDPYFRAGLESVMEKRRGSYVRSRFDDYDYDTDDDVDFDTPSDPTPPSVPTSEPPIIEDVENCIACVSSANGRCDEHLLAGVF